MRSRSAGVRPAASSRAFSAGAVRPGAVRGEKHPVCPVKLYKLCKRGGVQKVRGKGRVKVHVFLPRQVFGGFLGHIHAPHVGGNDSQPGEQIRNLPQHVRGAMDQVGGEGSRPVWKAMGSPSFSAWA